MVAVHHQQGAASIVMVWSHFRLRSCWSQFSRADTGAIFYRCTLEGRGMLTSRRRQFSSTSNDGKEHGYRVLLPRALPNPKGRDEEERIRLPRSISGWRSAFSNAWRDYSSTWEGFFGSEQQDDSKKEESMEKDAKVEMEDMVECQKKVVRGNVERNVAFVKEEGPKFMRFLQDETKIYTTEDLKSWAGEQLKLATKCVQEFMAGYRSGRDGELDKMLNEYFKEEGDGKGDDAHKRNRRKPKRLTRTS